jgi:hypothetical protein
MKTDLSADLDSASVAGTAEPEYTTAARLGSKRRRILGWAGLFILLALVAQLGGSCLQPLRVLEGPMVQQPSESSAIVVWYTTRETPCTFTYAGPDGIPVSVGVETNGLRHIARLTGLNAATMYAYEIKSPSRHLAAATLRTNKPTDRPFTFVAFGDSGRGTQAQYRLAWRMTEISPDFVVHTGDLIYPAGERKHYPERFFQPYRTLLATVAFWPSLGNHDVAKESAGDPYRDVFELPANGPVDQPAENNYWFDYASARFVVLDSNLDESALANSVAPWMSQVVTSSDARWKFVVFHHPPYTFATHAPAGRIQTVLVPLFEELGVDIVFCGHDHLYERTLPIRGEQIVDASHGVVYVVSGAGGASLYKEKDPSRRPSYVAAIRDDVFSFTTVAIDGGSLTLTQTSVEGDEFDRWSKSK